MQNKTFLSRLRVLIAAGSLGGFIGGWALLAQAGSSNVSETSSPALVELMTTPTPTALIAATPTSAKAATVVTQPTATATKVQATATSASAATPKLRTGGS